MPRLTSLAVAEQVFSDKNFAQNFLCMRLLLCAELTKPTKQKHPKCYLQIHKDNQKPALKLLVAKSNLAIWGKGFDIAGLGLVGPN